MKTVKRASVLVFLAALFLPGSAFAQTDPSVQGGPARAGSPLGSVNSGDGTLQFFQNGQARFQDIESVTNSPTGNNGLGPRFNFVQCSGCHLQPAVCGRSDAGSCSLQQPSFALAQQTNNIIFRIPTPTFGTGLMENLDDSTLLRNQAANANNNLGISGAFNHSGTDGTISRFGWKAQNKSLELFAGEAYNVEMGISNEIFTQDRPLPGEDMHSGLPTTCLNLSGSGYPEDTTNFATKAGTDQFATNASIPSDTVMFAMFMRLLAPPTPSTTTPGGATSIANGRRLFSAIGCATCHTPTLSSTQASNFTDSLSNAPMNAFSDIEIHHMGTVLADNVSQGGAGGDQFRTAPLWGLGQRIFLLHDGRTTNLLMDIEAHESNGSEATQAESNFDLQLTSSQQQDVLNFLRSL